MKLARGAPVFRVLAELAARAAAGEVRARLKRLDEEPLGFIARALGAQHRQIQSEGRSWDEHDIREFLDVHLGQALEDAERGRP